MPDYFCNQALMPLRFLPVQLVFYPVTERLNPDWSLVNNLVTKYGCPDIFVLVHYFGFPSEIPPAVQFCQQNGSELLEDCAHVLMPFDEIGKHSWAVVYSPYKLLPVPKLGILVTSEKIEFSKEIFIKRTRVDINTCRWITKRLLQSFLIHYKIPWKTWKTIPFELDEELNFEENRFVNMLSLQLLKLFEPELEKYKTMRRTHYKIIEEQVLSINNYNISPFFPVLPEDVCPYLFPMRLPESIIENAYYHLSRMGIPVQTWPDLPPEVKESPFDHGMAIRLRKNVLTLPIHQSLTKNQVERMAQSLREAILSTDCAD